MSVQPPDKPTSSHYSQSAPMAAAMTPLIDGVRSNAEMISQLGLIVARANQTLAARQAAAINEAMDDLTSLINQSMPNATDPNAAMRAYSAYSQSLFRRGVEHLSFAVESAAELSKAALEVARQRFLAEPNGGRAQPNGKYPAGKK